MFSRKFTFYKSYLFDIVVSILVFCTIPDPIRALEELKRVSKPGAKILFFEHVRMNHPLLGHLQDTLTPAWKKICDGCHLNRNTHRIITDSGLEVKKMESYYKGLFIVVECTI
ncbi:class I SAM-dependent methyltransferase [Cytobacillus sp. FJAT-54145]|uniref:Class I SAM-dependent methyltransferase n=1 Tax=Cytobacillus spartinae TaxID=3299023 RepID=A0ABW6KFR6_9BACI